MRLEKWRIYTRAIVAESRVKLVTCSRIDTVVRGSAAETIIMGLITRLTQLLLCVMGESSICM